MSTKKHILFLCTGNSCRSQMAEGWARTMHASIYNSYSAGILAQGLNPNAIRAMKERSVDISSQSSKTLDDLQEIQFDLVITVCSNAHETCPVFNGNARVIHHAFDDPPHLALQETNEADRFAHYQRVRDEIECFVRSLPEIIDEQLT